jgi:hypothetical protein
MQEILSKHRQDFSEIRRLCLICHGLDYSTSSFSSSQPRLHLSENLESSLQNLISSSLLSLAIALRINLYQGIIDKAYLELPDSSWLYFDEELIDRPATIKQVIDKIIHADTVVKPVLPSGLWKSDTKIAIQFKGTEFGKKDWTLNIILERFAEDVLRLLDEVEAQSA